MNNLMKKLALALGLAIVPFQVAQATVSGAVTGAYVANYRTTAEILLRTITALVQDPKSATTIAGLTAGAVALSTIAGYKAGNMILENIKSCKFSEATKMAMATALTGAAAGLLSSLISFSTPLTPASLGATNFLSSLQIMLWSIPAYQVVKGLSPF